MTWRGADGPYTAAEAFAGVGVFRAYAAAPDRMTSHTAPTRTITFMGRSSSLRNLFKLISLVSDLPPGQERSNHSSVEQKISLGAVPQLERSITVLSHA